MTHIVANTVRVLSLAIAIVTMLSLVPDPARARQHAFKSLHPIDGIDVVEVPEDRCVELAAGQCTFLRIGEKTTTPNGTVIEVKFQGSNGHGHGVTVCVGPDGKEIHAHVNDNTHVEIRPASGDQVDVIGATGPAGRSTTVTVRAENHSGVSIVSEGSVNLHGSGNTIETTMSGGHVTLYDGGNTVRNEDNDAGGTVYESGSSTNSYDHGGETYASGHGNTLQGSWTPLR